MTNDLQHLQTSVDSVLDFVKTPFWKHEDFLISFIIGTILGVIGIYYARRAFVEAEEAKKAARAAGRTVKFQSVAIELREFKLGTLADDIRFTTARDFLTDTTQRLHRILSPFEKETQFGEKILKLWDVLSKTRESLNSVKPPDQKSELQAPQAVYNAIENHFATINELVGDLVGLFEQKTTNFGDNDAND